MTHAASSLATVNLLVLAMLACSSEPAAPAASATPLASKAPASEAPAPKASPEPPPAANAKPDCKVLDLAMLRDALGAPALELEREGGEGSVLQCRYVVRGGPSVLVQIQRDAKREYFDAAREASFPDLAKPVEGVGDTAYSVSVGAQNTLVTLAGDRSIQLSGSFDADHLRTLIEKLIEAKPF